MSFTDEYLEEKKKKKKTTAAKTGHSYTDDYLSEREKSQALEEDIAPVKTTVTRDNSAYYQAKKDKQNTKQSEERTWFKAGAFDDGYDVGDVTKTILGTVGDAGLGMVKGLAYIGEGVGDLINYGDAAISEKLGNQKRADRIRERTAESMTDILLGGLEKKVDRYSVLGEKSDSVAQGIGQVATIIATGGIAGAAGAGTVGATAATMGMMGASSMGSGMGEAYLSGATDEEAATYGLIKGAVDAGSELLFGGLGKTIKVVGLSRGLTSADDWLARKLSEKVTNHIAKNFVQFGVKASGEGLEEVIAGVGSAMAKQATYMDDKELGELLKDENLMEQFVVGAVTSGIAQSGIVPGMKSGSLVEANKTGRDFISGLSQNEQKVIDKELENRISEREKDGEKLTQREKDKLYDAIVSDMEKGYISTETIEEVLGGDTYKNYKSISEQEDSLKSEFDTLNKMKQGEMTGEQIDRRAELKQQLEDIKQNSQRDQFKSRLSEEVRNMVQNDRLTESYNERFRRGQVFEADLTQYDEKQQETIKKAAESGILNNTRRTHEFVDMIAKISADKGVLFDFTNNQKLKESGFAVDGKTVNGYVTKDGVTLNINSKKSLNSVVGHEITHVLEGTELYTALQSVVTEYAKTKGDYQSRYDSLAKLYEGIEGADVNAELTADLVGDYLFTDSDFIHNLSTNHRNVFQKIYDEVKYLCKVATAGSKEARELEKVKRAFEKAYKADSKAENGTKYSVSDSTGKELTKEQQDYFKDSKVLDVDGNLKVMYQGGNGDFTVFDRKKSSYSNLYGRGFYFTDSESHAKQYGNARAFYLDIKNPVPTKERTITKDQMRNFLEAVAENEDDYSFENYGYGATVDSVLDSIYSGKSDFAMLYDVSQTAIGDMVEAVELFNEVNGTDFDGLILDTETVTFRSNQAKNTDNQKPTVDADIRFSLSKSVEETRDLMALHNLQSSELLKTLDLGGLPMPSIAVIKAEAGHDQYGDVSLILPKETIDPKTNKDNKVYGGDAWTPVYPKIEYKPNEKVAKNIRDKYYGLANNIGYDAVRPMYSYVNELEDTLNRAGGEAAMLEKLYEDTDMMNVYLQDSGKGKVEPIVKETVTEISEAEAEMNQFLIDALGEDFVSGFKAPAGENPMKYRVAFMEQHESKIRDAYKRLFMEQYDFTEEEANNALDNTTKRDLMKIMREAYMYTRNKGVTVKTETDYNATREAIRNAASDGYKEWVDGLFKGVEGKSGIRNNQDYYTRSGNPRSWDALHWENTLENVVKVMRGQEDTGVDSFSPFNNLFGKAHKRYGSIEEIKADSNRLRKIPEEEYEALKDSFSTRFAEIANSIKDPGERNPYIAADNAAELIVDAVSTQKTKSGMLNYLRKWNSRATAQTVDDVVSLVSDIANMPTGYFEAKPKRAVGFDEVGVFVIPNNIDANVKQELLNRGYSIAEYDPNVEGDRTKVLNQFEEYKFSLSDVGAEPKTYGNYNVFGKDIALDSPTVSKTESVQESAPVVDAENATTTPVSEETPPIALYNKRDGKNGWGKTYATAQEALNNAVQYVDGKLWDAFNEEIDNTPRNKPLPRGSMPVTDAFVAVQEDVRQETITPMQGAQLLSEAYKHGGVNTLRGLYNPHTGNLYSRYLEQAKQDGTFAFNDLMNIVMQSRRENMRGAYTHNGKQYLSDGSFIVEFNTVDESLEQSKDFPIKQAVKELDEAFGRQVEGNYELHTSDTKGFVKVGNSLFGTKRVNALIRALENPVFSIAKVHGGHEALIVTADNGRAVLMPVRASGNAYLVYEAQPIADAATFPDDLAPIDEAYEEDRIASLDDADMPPETEVPYYEDDSEGMEAEDPFDERDWYEVGNRKVKAYMYDHPEVKPYFQAEAAVMLDELQNTTKGEKWYNDHLYYESGGEEGFGGTKRHTSDSIATMLDEWKMSYADIEKGLRAIIEDHGAENIAAAKKVEFMLNERLLDGYKSFVGYEPTMDRFGNVPQNQDYINMLAESQIVDAYSKESFDALMAEADAYAPPISEEIVEDIAPVAMKRESNPTLTEKPKKEAYEAIRPKREKQPKLIRVDNADSEPSGKQRKWVKTSTESEAVDGKILPEDLNQEKIHYQPIPNKVTLNKANTRLDSMGYESAVTYFNSQFANKSVSLEDVALGERLIQEAIKRGDNKTAGELIQNVSILGTELGQKVQALSIIKRLTPEGQLGMLQKTVERGKTKGDKAFEGVELTQEMIDKILSAYNPDGTYDQMVLNEMVEDAKQQIADQMKVTTMDKVNAWRYLSMLGNPKTHIRNLVSNVAMRGTVGVKNAVARTIESIAPISNRTKTWASASEEVQNYARRMTEEAKGVISGDSKYSDSASIKEKRAIFKNKILNGLYEFNSDMLSKEDWWFSKPAYTNALSEFLTANGIRTEQEIKKNPELVEKAKQYALEQSQIATFRQYSWLANQIGEIERKNAATNIAVGAILPFKKTPVNIAKTGLNYSPLGFMKTLTYDASQVKKGNMEASEMVDHLAQNITGSALSLVGYLLAQSGFLNGAGDDDKEGDYDYQLGKQAYSVNIGDATYSLSWLSPVAMPLFVGANAYEQLVEGKEWNGDVVVETLAQTLDPLSEMSFISSLDSVLSSYDSGIQKFAGIGETMAQNYITQFAPTFMSQVATVMDDTKRSTRVSGDSDFKFVDQTINKLKYKIPLLRETLEPSTDIWGNEVKQTENIMARAVETFLAPYARKDSIATAVDEEIKDLYAETGDTGLIPSIPYNNFSYDGEKYKMSAEDYTEFKQTYGQTAVDLMGELFQTDTYKTADSETRADMVNKVYDYARDEARKEYCAKYGVKFTNSTKDGVEVYKPNSIKGAIEHDMTPDEYSFYAEYPDKYKFFSENGITYETYKNADEDGKRAYTWAYENPGKYEMSKAISDDFMEFYEYKSTLNDFRADKDANGDSISGTAKAKKVDYINSLDLDYGQRIILYRSLFDGNADKNKYNAEIVNYLNSRDDISYDEMVTILGELDMTVDSDGNVSW